MCVCVKAMFLKYLVCLLTRLLARLRSSHHWCVGVQMYDRWRIQRAQMKSGVGGHPWEAKGGLLYHIDLGLDLVIRVNPVLFV